MGSNDGSGYEELWSTNCILWKSLRIDSKVNKQDLYTRRIWIFVSCSVACCYSMVIILDWSLPLETKWTSALPCTFYRRDTSQSKNTKSRAVCTEALHIFYPKYPDQVLTPQKWHHFEDPTPATGSNPFIGWSLVILRVATVTRRWFQVKSMVKIVVLHGGSLSQQHNTYISTGWNVANWKLKTLNKPTSPTQLQ